MVVPKLVLIDVDTGVDDAWALAMLIKAEHTRRVRIVAITTVCGNTSVDNGTRNTVRVLETLHRTDVYINELECSGNLIWGILCANININCI